MNREIVQSILIRHIEKKGIPHTINSSIEELSYLIIALSHFMANRNSDEKVPKVLASVQIYLDELKIIFKEKSFEFHHVRLMNQIAREIETRDGPPPIPIRSRTDPKREEYACSICKEIQVRTPSGLVCKNGHEEKYK